MKITIDSDLEKLLKSFNNDEKIMKEASNIVKKTLYNIEKDAKQNLDANGNVDTGRLKGSITTNIIGQFNGEVGTNVEYANIIEEGSRPHAIRPNKKKYLYWQGAEHPVKEVNHPGTKASPFMEPAAIKNEKKFNQDLEKLAKEILK